MLTEAKIRAEAAPTPDDRKYSQEINKKDSIVLSEESRILHDIICRIPFQEPGVAALPIKRLACCMA